MDYVLPCPTCGTRNVYLACDNDCETFWCYRCKDAEHYIHNNVVMQGHDPKCDNENSFNKRYGFHRNPWRIICPECKEYCDVECDLDCGTFECTTCKNGKEYHIAIDGVTVIEGHRAGCVDVD